MKEQEFSRSNAAGSMYHGTLQKNGEIRERSFSLEDVLRTIKKYIFLIILIILVCALGYGFGQAYLDPPMYQSTATIFLTPKFNEEGDLDQSSISTNRTLLSNAMALMTRGNIMVQVAEDIGNMSAEEIQKTLQVEQVGGTELISVTATTQDPQLSKRIVESTVSAFIVTMQERLNLDNITIVDQAKLNFDSVSTPLTTYIIEGAGLGLIISAALIALIVLLDKRLKSKEDAERYLGLPVLVVLPDLDR